MKRLEVKFRQCTYCLQNVDIMCIAYRFSPLHEMPDIFRHFKKCLISQIVCNIYIYHKDINKETGRVGALQISNIIIKQRFVLMHFSILMTKLT